MNLNIINTIVAVSRSKSFLEASYAVNYTPAVISKHIASAERELGVKLFTRGNKANVLVPTVECEALLDDFNAIKLHWDRIEGYASLFVNQSSGMTVRRGMAQKVWSARDSEIISEFIIKNQDVTVDVVHGYSSDLLGLLKCGKLDAVFTSVRGGFGDVNFMRSFKSENDCEFFPVGTITDMYIAVSEDDPVARNDECPFSAFREHTIAFNSDKMALMCGHNMIPFLKLSEKYGFDLKTTYLSTMDASAYRIARKQKVAIPIPSSDLSYPGLKYIKLTDWSDSIVTYFITMRQRRSRALERFSRFVYSSADADSHTAV